ncbi:MAG: hypothetical protein R3D71_06050 [Rickettsiales bacterium]
MAEENKNRNLTDADVAAITEALRNKVIKQFYQDLGKGVWGLVWRVIVLALIAIAAYGARESLK